MHYKIYFLIYLMFLEKNDSICCPDSNDHLCFQDTDTKVCMDLVIALSS